MIEEKKLKFGKREKVKNGFMEGKQRYKCKCCGYNYIGSKNGYPDHIKLKAIKYYLEGNGFRRIERLMRVSHVSVINWVKQFIFKFKNIPKQHEKVDVLELDEICVSLKKIWLWTAVNRKTKRLVGFHVGDRSSKSFENLCKNISHIDARFYATAIFSL